MRILQIHNEYVYFGGEDAVVENERKMLRAAKHEVSSFIRSNREINHFSIFEKSELLWKTTWSTESAQMVRRIIERFNPDICHVHNVLPLITPSVYYICDQLDVPVVQTLHNYRLLCTAATLFRNGCVCEECIGRSVYHSVRYGCYRGSRIQTIASAHMIEHHKRMRTWNEKIDAYICLTNFSREIFARGGLPVQRLFLKPNFLSVDPGVSNSQEQYVFFAGRLDKTKGLTILQAAARRLPTVQFLVAGTGPLHEQLIDTKPANVALVDQKSREQIHSLMKNCLVLLFPSIWYECMPMSIIEAYACGKPVIATNLGVMRELVKDSETGILFEPDSADNLASKIEWACTHPEELTNMGNNARKEFEAKYSEEINYPLLMNIYEQAIANRKERCRR